MDNRTEQLADGVWRVELSFWVCAVVLAVDGGGGDAGLTLVDTGTRAMGPRLVRSVRMLGLDPRAVGDVLLTHWHADHAGGARRFAESSAKPRVWIGADDLPVLRGERRHRDTADDASGLSRLLHRHVHPGPAPVATALPLHDGDVHDAAGGAHVVSSPGHTAGHIALHLPERGVLIAGDAVTNLLGLRPSPAFLSSARSHVAASVRRLAALEFDVLVPMHGPPIDRDAKARLAALLD